MAAEAGIDKGRQILTLLQGDIFEKFQVGQADFSKNFPVLLVDAAGLLRHIVGYVDREHDLFP